jgi:TRAP transporter TAXI family solute receptor
LPAPDSGTIATRHLYNRPVFMIARLAVGLGGVPGSSGAPGNTKPGKKRGPTPGTKPGTTAGTKPGSVAVAAIVGVAVAALLTGCRAPAAAPRPQRVKVLARAENPRGLINYYNETMPGVQSSLQIIPGSAFVVNALKHGDAELGYAQADVVYTAYRSGLASDPTPYTNLRAIAVIQRANVFVVVRRDSAYSRIADLKGARLGIDPEGSYGAVYAKVLLKAAGLSDTDVALTHLSTDQMSAGIRAKTLDGAIFVLGSIGPLIIDLNRAVGIRVLDVERQTINALRGRYPFLNPTTITAGEMPDQSNDIQTFGVENVLICRRELTEELVYRLTAGLFAKAELNERLSDVRPLDLEEAPATPIPLHPGAARYYREREVLQQ